jgi:hypothetical protein
MINSFQASLSNFNLCRFSMVERYFHFYGYPDPDLRDPMGASGAAGGQGLTLVHLSAEREPFCH